MEETNFEVEDIEEEIGSRTPPKKKSRWVKYIVRTLAVLFATFIALWGMAQYVQWREIKDIEEIAEGLERLAQEEHERAMTDTYGGETPQETLRRFCLKTA